MSILKRAMTRARTLLLRTFFMVPVIGQMASDIRRGEESAIIYFGANIAMLWLIVGLTWGIAGFLGGAYILVPCYFIILLTMMRG